MAHRVAWSFEHGDVPAGMVLDHMCFNTMCVRPSHLRSVTPKQNIEHRARANSNSSTGVRGVSFAAGAYVVRAKHNRRTVNGGRFKTLAEAEARAVQLRAELFTHDDALAPS
ncbi:HNH endonuclease [Curtobacterium sp. P97]|uniref:HNH endonuclease n=1 Tax=Curtobacterium sp. P97 TaxID=2939562 RepID=UPI0034D741D2